MDLFTSLFTKPKIDINQPFKEDPSNPKSVAEQYTTFVKSLLSDTPNRLKKAEKSIVINYILNVIPNIEHEALSFIKKKGVSRSEINEYTKLYLNIKTISQFRSYPLRMYYYYKLSKPDLKEQELLRLMYSGYTSDIVDTDLDYTFDTMVTAARRRSMMTNEDDFYSVVYNDIYIDDNDLEPDYYDIYREYLEEPLEPIQELDELVIEDITDDIIDDDQVDDIIALYNERNE
jgi:hypothetical protein